MCGEADKERRQVSVFICTTRHTRRNASPQGDGQRLRQTPPLLGAPNHQRQAVDDTSDKPGVCTTASFVTAAIAMVTMEITDTMKLHK